MARKRSLRSVGPGGRDLGRRELLHRSIRERLHLQVLRGVPAASTADASITTVLASIAADSAIAADATKHAAARLREFVLPEHLRLLV